jgi:hypothetical protein
LGYHFYDDSGKLMAVQDANGNLTQFVHNPTITAVIGLTVNLLIPEEVNESMMASGIPGFQELSSLRQGEVR